MNRWEKIIRLHVTDGPEWQLGHCYDDELLEFGINKFTSEFGRSPVELYGRFSEPVKVLVRVNYVASSIHARDKVIVGVITNEPSWGKLRPEVKYDTNLTYLRQRDDVTLIWTPSCKSGYIVFNGNWLRMCAQGEALNFLTTDEYLTRNGGRMLELVQYAHLKEQVTDIGKIQFVRNIERYADINEPSPEVYNLDYHHDSAKDSLLMELEQPIILC